MPSLDLEFIRAQPSDYRALIDLLDDAARWHVAHGIDQWQPGGWNYQWIGEPIERGKTYLVRRAGKLVGTVTLEESARWVWTEDPAGGASYVYRLAIPSDERGQGIGRAVLEWVEQRARESGTAFLRLDCPAGNARLCAYYEAFGFARRGERTMAGEGWSYRGALYEKAVA